jgi:hypothetical protein
LIAQKENEGIYLSANDFTNGKISYTHNINDGNYKFRLHDISFNSPIKIIAGNKIISVNKDLVYGYRDKENTCYRFYNKGTFKILNPFEKIILYSTSSLVGSPRNIHRLTNYFFSADAASPIYKLTKWNMKMILGKDVYFHELLDIYFQSDDELTAYDDLNKIYLLNRIYNESKQTLSKINKY